MVVRKQVLINFIGINPKGMQIYFMEDSTMAKTNFLKGILRANSGNYGDLEGPMTNLKSGKLTLAIEKGKCIAWIVNEEDVELSKDNVASVEPISTGIAIKDLTSGGGKDAIVNVYRITLKNGQVGTLRLVANSEYKVLQIIK